MKHFSKSNAVERRDTTTDLRVISILSRLDSDREGVSGTHQLNLPPATNRSNNQDEINLKTNGYMKKKEEYLAPTISIVAIEIESGIASGSAKVNPGSDGTDIVEHEWEVGEDVEREFEW